MEQPNVLAICGSIREKSFNRALLRAAQDLAGDSFKVDVWDDYAHLPRVDATRGRPFPATGSAHRHLDGSGVLVGEAPRREIAKLWQRVLSGVGDNHPLVST
jgi:NAD(P)H-dependent FMN reductase